MSENVYTYGWIGELCAPVTEEEYDHAHDHLDQAGLSLNHEGTLIFSNVHSGDLVEDFGFNLIPKAGGKHGFVRETAVAGYAVRGSTVREYLDLWYNGTDSNHASLTLAQYKEKL